MSLACAGAPARVALCQAHYVLQGANFHATRGVPNVFVQVTMRIVRCLSGSSNTLVMSRASIQLRHVSLVVWQDMVVSLG